MMDDLLRTPYPTAQPFLPPRPTLPAMATAVQACRGCDLYRDATQAVFGEGPSRAPMLFIGEQPGDQEDRAGRPFVGPAGRIWDRALAEAGIDRSQVYVTNAVKHFRFEERGKRRLHKKPTIAQVEACRPWLDAELKAVQPRLVVALGATALQSLIRNAASVLRDRGRIVPFQPGLGLFVTVHPSYLLRVPPESREAEFKHFAEDLRLAGHHAGLNETESGSKHETRL